MLSAENLELIEREGMRLAAACRRDPGRDVPQYPGWCLADLASHTASIHGRTVLICRQLPTERISAPRLPDGADPIDWCEEKLIEMLRYLRDVDPETPAWAFGPEQVIGFWETRMLIETGVHRWDAEQVFGDPDPLIPEVAGAGLDEFGDLYLGHLGAVETLRVIARDLGATWTYGDGEPVSVVSGTGSDLYLRLVSRPSQVQLPEDWAHAVDALAPPPKR